MKTHLFLFLAVSPLGLVAACGGSVSQPSASSNRHVETVGEGASCIGPLDCYSQAELDANAVSPDDHVVCPNGEGARTHWDCSWAKSYPGVCVKTLCEAEQYEGASCNTASDCPAGRVGPSRSCNDGTDGPGHFDCNDHVCKIVECEPVHQSQGGLGIPCTTAACGGPIPSTACGGPDRQVSNGHGVAAWSCRREDLNDGNARSGDYVCQIDCPY